MIVHGDGDQILPIDASAQRSVELVRDATLKVYPGARTVCSPPTGAVQRRPARLPRRGLSKRRHSTAWFLVPVTFVVYAFERHADQVLTTQRIFAAFVYGGVLGVLGASVLEAAFLKRPSAATYLGVGLVEEAVKLAALGLLAWRLPRYTMRDGIVLGAAVGFGFAALESAGYAFNALFTMEGLSLRNLVETEVLRGLLTPVGHGLWTAILGGVPFRTAARTGRLRLTGGLVGWYLLVALLHTLWDASRGVAVWLTLLLMATQVQWALIQMGRVPEPTQAQVHTFTMISWGLLLDALLGVAVLRGRWQQALALERAQPPPRPPLHS